jgi:hypothetical protein
MARRLNDQMEIQLGVVLQIFDPEVIDDTKGLQMPDGVTGNGNTSIVSMKV